MSRALPTVQQTCYTFPVALASRLAQLFIGRGPAIPAAQMLADAERKVGFQGWGGLDMMGPLGLMERDFEALPPSGLGRVVLRGTIGKAIENRLRILRALKERKPPQALTPPLIVVGLHRTGTTLLHHLLSVLPGHSWIPMYRMVSPVHKMTARLEANTAKWSVDLINPEFQIAHPSSSSSPEECWLLMMSTLRVPDFLLHWELPRYEEFIDNHDMLDCYREYRDTLRLMSLDFPGRLVLKNPHHLNALPALLEAMPDARIVWTHRDPASSVGSFGTLSALHRRTIYGRYDAARVGENTLARFAMAARKGTEARASLPKDRFLDVPYESLAGDPLGTVRAICRHFGDAFTEEGEARVRAELAHMKKETATKHVYSLEQWGLSREKINAAFAPYFDVYGREAGVR